MVASVEWYPMPPSDGPPLPRFLNILWPWITEPSQNGNGMIETYWYDQYGNPLSRAGLGAAVTINEGETSSFETFITNATTKAGEPWEATLDIDITAKYGTPPFEAMMAPMSYPATYFAPGERKGPFSGSITPYLGSAARGGVLNVIVSRGGVTVTGGLDVTPITIVLVPVEYGVIIDIT